MVRDLEMPFEIIGVPTVREPDGLALSSRNRYLSPSARSAALVLSRALNAGVEAAPKGMPSVLAAGRTALETAHDVRIDYFVLRDPDFAAGPHLWSGAAAGRRPGRLCPVDRQRGRDAAVVKLIDVGRLEAPRI